MSGQLKIIASVWGLQNTNVGGFVYKEQNPQTLRMNVTQGFIPDDGWPGHEKCLTIVYRYDTLAPGILIAKSNDSVYIGFDEYNKSLAQPAPPGSPDNVYNVVAATYGTADVTAKVRSLVSTTYEMKDARGGDGRQPIMVSTGNVLASVLNCKADNATFGDPWFGVEKALIVVLGHQYNTFSVNVFKENSPVSLNLMYTPPPPPPPSTTPTYTPVPYDQTIKNPDGKPLR